MEEFGKIQMHFLNMRKYINFCFSGRQDDDGGGGDIRGLLAALSRVLHRDLALSETDGRAFHPGGLPGLLLARHVQQHVQSHNLLLDEFQVLYTTYSPSQF